MGKEKKAEAEAAAEGASTSTLTPSPPPPLLARRLGGRPPGRLRRWWRGQRNEDGTAFTAAAVVNALLVLAVCVGIAVGVLLNSVRSASLVLIPVGLYSLIWYLYPAVEPSDGAEQAVEVMAKHPYSWSAQFEGCTALFAITRTLTSDGREDLAELGVAEACLNAGLRFEDDADIVARAVAVVGALVSLADVGAALADDGLVELFAAWMERHLLVESMQKHSLTVLVTLMSSTDVPAAQRVRKRALAVGMIPLVAKIMDAHGSVGRIQQWGCVVLFEITSDEPDEVDILFREGVVELVTKTMLNHATSDNVQRLCVGILVKCLTEHPGNRDVVKRVQALREAKSRVFEAVEKARKDCSSIKEVAMGTKRIMDTSPQAFTS